MKIDKNEVLRYLGHRGQEFSKEIDIKIDFLIDNAYSVCNPKSVWGVFEPEFSDKVCLKGTNLVLEGQDILNLFFIAFNKYTGKADKNQAFTPDHITEFMCRLTDIDRNTVVLDPTCGSGSFLVQAMVKELADCRNGRTEEQFVTTMKDITYKVKECEKRYGIFGTHTFLWYNSFLPTTKKRTQRNAIVLLAFFIHGIS